jgi:hypothetical protein
VYRRYAIVSAADNQEAARRLDTLGATVSAPTSTLEAQLFERISSLANKACSTQTLDWLCVRLFEVVVYRGFLGVIVERHGEAATIVTAVNVLFSKKVNAKAEGMPVEFNEDDIANLAAWPRALKTLRLDIESFYVFAKILLDRLADGFGYYFAERFKRKGSTYAQLSKHFGAIAASRTLVPPNGLTIRELRSEMNRLRREIVNHRTEAIEHVPVPNLVGIIGPPDGSGTPVLARGDLRTGDLDKLLARIDGHIEVMLQLFEANMNKCALKGTAT